MADTHLGAIPYHLEEREEDIYEGFKSLIDKAIEERVDFIVHSGDFFHNFHPSNHARKVMMEQMKRLEEKGIKVFGVLGDHDLPKRRDYNPLVLYPNIKLFEVRDDLSPEIVEYRGVTIVGIPSLRGIHRVKILHKILENLDEKISGKKNVILILHQAIKEYFGIEGQYELELGHLPKNVDYYALGHLHDRRCERFGRGYIAYAGSIDILRKSEIKGWEKSGKGAYVVDMGDEIEVTPINLNIRPHFVFEVSSVDELDERIGSMEFEKKPVIYVTLNTEERDMPREEVLKIESLLKDVALHYDISINRSIGESNIGKIEMENLNLRDIILRWYGDEKTGNLAYEIFEILKDLKESDFAQGIPSQIKDILSKDYGGDLL